GEGQHARGGSRPGAGDRGHATAVDVGVEPGIAGGERFQVGTGDGHDDVGGANDVVLRVQRNGAEVVDVGQARVTGGLGLGDVELHAAQVHVVVTDRGALRLADDAVRREVGLARIGGDVDGLVHVRADDGV